MSSGSAISCALPRAPAIGTDGLPGHSFAVGEYFFGQQGLAATDSFSEKGRELWCTEVEAVTLPSWLDQHKFWRVEAVWSQFGASGQGGAVSAKDGLLAAQGEHRPYSPQDNVCGGGFLPPGPGPLGAEPWPDPCPGPMSVVFPGHSASGWGGRPARKCGPRVKGRSSGCQGERPIPRTRPQGPWELGLMSRGWDTWP